MKINLWFLTLIAVLFAGTLSAQEQEDALSIHLHGIFSLPNSSFGKFSDSKTEITNRDGIKVGDKIGLSEKGFGIGAELSTPIWFKGFNWVFSARVLLNGADGSEVQARINSPSFYGPDSSYWQPDTVSGSRDTVAVLELGTWLNIPLMTGFRYDYEISSKLKLYGIAQAGINLTQAPSLKASVKLPTAATDTTIQNTKYDIDNAFGFDVGIGLIFNDKYNLGLRYVDFGDARYNGTNELNPSYLRRIFRKESAIIGEQRRISMFLLTLGIML